MVIDLKVLKYDNKILFEKVVMSTDFKRMPKLFSADEACFMFLTKGAFLFRTPANLLNFNEGDAMLSKCGNYFIEQVILNKDQQHKTISAIGAYFYPDIVKQFFETELDLQKLQTNFDTTKVSINPLLKSFIDSIDYLLENPALADDNMIVTKLKELLLLLSKSEKAASINSFVSSLFVPYEYDFKEIIQQNLYDNLSLQEFAKLSNMSLATFKRKFTDLYKESPAKYLLSKKLEKASQLLQIKSKPISDVAYECGFESISGFDKSFKKYFAKSPSEFRLT